MGFFPVKWFSSSDGGVPQLSGTPGAKAAVLEACLITGFNEQPVAQLTWSNGVATARTNQNNRFSEYDVVLVQGANTADFNGEFRLQSASENEVKFAVAGSGLPATISGNITIKKAPVGGWVQVFSGSNTVAYRSDDQVSRKHCLRIDDTEARFARVRGYESMTSINNGTAPWPTPTQYGGNGLTWIKSDAANAVAKEWILIADSCFFYLFTRPWAAQGMSAVWFGDLVTPWPGDLYASMLQGHAAATPTFAGDYNRLFVTGESTGRYLPRSGHGVGGSVSAGIYGMQPQTYSGYGAGWAFPNQPGGRMMSNPLVVGEVNGSVMVGARGYLPGAYQPLHNQPLSGGDRLAGISINGSGRVAMMIDFSVDATNRGRVAIDVDGPWR